MADSEPPDLNLGGGIVVEPHDFYQGAGVGGGNHHDPMLELGYGGGAAYQDPGAAHR